MLISAQTNEVTYATHTHQRPPVETSNGGHAT